MIPLPPEPARGGDILQWAQGVQKCLRALRPTPGPGIRISEGPNSTTFSADPQKGGGAAAKTYHPFQVLTRANPGSTTGAMQAGVIFHSSLYKSLKPNDKFPITGLLSEDRTSGWFNLEPNDAIWLGITFDSSGEPTWAGIESWGQSGDFDIEADAWSGDNGYCEDDGGDPPKHQTSRKLIAYSVPGGEDQPVLTQVMFHDQLLRNVCIDGRPARYPFDHEGGYPL